MPSAQRDIMQTFEENITLHGVLQTLIVPSAFKEDSELCEKGTKALALCCLIDRVSLLKCQSCFSRLSVPTKLVYQRIASEFFKKFIQKLSTSPADIRVIIAHALIDICMVHKKTIFRDDSNNVRQCLTVNTRLAYKLYSLK